MVLWASQPVATATVSKGGATNGSSVSFAYGLSSGKLERFSRIWADGRLIRDEVGRQEIEFEAILHEGSEDQTSDALIESILGEESSPAFRGISYILFENFDLTSFGNRIPLITVEVYSSDEELSAEELVCTGLGLGKPSEHSRHYLEGYAASGDDQMSAISALLRAFDPAFTYRDGRWALANDPSRHSIDRDLWTGLCIEGGMIEDAGTTQLPTRVSIRFYDPALDFAAGEKSARLPGRELLRRIELPAALTGEAAKAAASERLSRLQTGSDVMWLPLPFTYADVELGDHVFSEDNPAASLIVCGKSFRKGKFGLLLRRGFSTFEPSVTKTSARSMARALARSPLKVALVELPSALSDSEPAVAVLISGGHEPFQPLPLTISHVGKAQVVASALRSAPSGRLLEKLPFATSELFDLRHRMLVRFEEDPNLTSCDEDELLAGANLISLGGEFIQYSTAIPLGDGMYELTTLLRGRFDSLPAGDHEIGTPLHLLEASRMAKIALDRNVIGSILGVQVHGPDGAEASACTTISGLAARPWSPVDLHACEKPDGIEVSWTKRSKDGLPWLDEVDTSFGTLRENYVVSVIGQSNERLDIHSEVQNVIIKSSELQQIGPRPWHVEVRQLGDFAASKPGVLTLS